jgi:hypothetical protein
MADGAIRADESMSTLAKAKLAEALVGAFSRAVDLEDRRPATAAQAR